MDLPASLRRLLYAFAGASVVLIAWYQWRGRTGSDHLLDFYPLYYGARSLLETGDAYGLASGAADGRGVALVGNAYPLHAVLLLGLPLAWLSPTGAAVAWTGLVGASWIMAVWWARESPYWFLWTPMLLALLLQQPAAAIGVAAVVAVGALRRGSAWPFALAIVVLTIKPQQSLLLALAFAWWGRRWWREVLIALTAVSAASFLAQPDWVIRWIDRIASRAELVPTVWYWPFLALVAAVLAWRGWRLSAVAVASTALGPWPAVGGWYSAAAWPVGAGRTQSAAMAMVGLGAAVAAVGTNRSEVFILVAGVGLVLSAVATPRIAHRRTALDAEGGGAVAHSR